MNIHGELIGEGTMDEMIERMKKENSSGFYLHRTEKGEDNYELYAKTEKK